jgi:ubiquinone/menaquinone biosynthesis C-methylase UbiE
VTWQIFERAAAEYEAWYATRRGRRADLAERELLLRLIRAVPDARSGVEIGCGTGHFAVFLTGHGLSMIGLDRAPAMLADAHRRFPTLPVLLGDAHRLPFRDRSMDVALFVTTLEFLEDPAAALREAVRVARLGVVAMVLNSHSLGGLSRRWGPQSRGELLGEAHDYSSAELRLALEQAAGSRLDAIWSASTLYPDGLSQVIGRVSLGEVIGSAVRLTR